VLREPVEAFGKAIKTQRREERGEKMFAACEQIGPFGATELINRGIRGIRGKTSGRVRGSAYLADPAVHFFSETPSQLANDFDYCSAEIPLPRFPRNSLMCQQAANDSFSALFASLRFKKTKARSLIENRPLEGQLGGGHLTAGGVFTVRLAQAGYFMGRSH